MANVVKSDSNQIEKPKFAEVRWKFALLQMSNTIGSPLSNAVSSNSTLSSALTSPSSSSGSSHRREIDVRDLSIGVSVGSGCNSVVYDGYIASTGQRVAVKIQNDNWGTTAAEKAARILRGEDLCEALRCPSLNACFATSCGGHFMLYPRVGGSLGQKFRSCVASGEPLLMAARGVARELFVALDYLHSRGLGHRDVHVGNALMDGSPSSVVLADFESVGTATGIDIEFDIISVAYVMSQLITGKLGLDHFPGDNASKAAARASIERGEAPTAYTSLLDAALARCLEDVEKEIASGLDASMTTHAFLAAASRRAEDGRSRIPTANAAWKLLTGSPSFHGKVEASTELQEALDGKHVVYLDRHNVNAADYSSALSGFHLRRKDTKDKICFVSWRIRLLQSPVASIRIINHHTEARPILPERPLSTIRDLPIRCDDSPGCYLKGFQLVRLGPDMLGSMEHVRFSYWTITGAVPAPAAPGHFDIVERTTPWNDAAGWGEGGNLLYLDRHDVSPEPGFALKGFVLEMRPKTPVTAAGIDEVRIKYWLQRIC